MKRIAIICEYNPLHSGHEYLLRLARRQFGANEVYCIMSGSFVQRGQPAVCDRFTRAAWAIEKGADLVCEMPALSGSFSADDFALFGIKAADALGATHLLFGSECGSIEQFIQASCAMEKDDFKTRLSAALGDGDSYPAAVSKALDCDLDLTKPNNLLGLSYVNALRRRNSSIIPLTTKRAGDYHSESVSENFMSATAVRAALAQNEPLDGFVSQDVVSDLIPFAPDRLNDFNELCFATAIKASKEDFAALYEVNEGLENRLWECAKTAKTYDEYVQAVKTKRYTLSKIKRILVHLLLGITKDFVREAYSAPYVRVLAVKKNEELLRHLSTKSDVYTKFGALPDTLTFIWQKENAAARLRDFYSQGKACQDGRDNAIII